MTPEHHPRALGRLGLLAAVLAIAACGPEIQTGQSPPPPGGRSYHFVHDPGVTIQVLSRDDFQWQHGGNTALPRTDAAVLALARKLYPPAGEPVTAFGDEPCGEHAEGVLMAALSNPDISDRARAQVDRAMAAATPSLPSQVTIGHFRLLYTTVDPNPRHNVDLSRLQATAQVLNDSWDAYVKTFTTPKHYLSGGKQLVDVRVYDLGGTLNGSTSSSWNYIKLNSERVVRSPCKRQTTPAHELYHRMQYAYGYLSGQLNLKWAIEGTAVWSQKFRAPHVGDYLVRMDSGLKYPDKHLFKRSYDAAHLWLHLGRWLGEVPAMQRYWTLHRQRFGHTRFPTLAALNDLLGESQGAGYDLEWLVEQWSLANVIKECGNASFTQTYEEQGMLRRCDNTRYGPVRALPRALTLGYPNACGGAPERRSLTINPWGSDYLTLTVGAAVNRLTVKLTGDAPQYAFAVVERDASGALLQVLSSGRRKASHVYSKVLTGSKVARLDLVVTSLGRQGSYSVDVQTDEASKCGHLKDQCNDAGCTGGACVKLPLDGTPPCDDGNPATKNDRCVKGVCQGS